MDFVLCYYRYARFLQIRSLIHTYICTYLHTYIHTYVHTYTHTYIHMYILTHIHTYICTYLHIYTHTYVIMYILTHTYIHMYRCIHLPITYISVFLFCFQDSFKQSFPLNTSRFLVKLASLNYLNTSKYVDIMKNSTQ